MEEATDLANYLPLSFKTPKEQEYIEFLWDAFEKGLIALGKDVEKGLLAATSPFAFSVVPERAMLRFLKLIACDNSKIGTYAKLVDDRNESAHPNGNIFFSTQAALDIKITEMLRGVDEIQTHSEPIIQRCYSKFLEDNHDPEVREYPDDEDQIREVLIHENYLSQKDIEICAAYDLSPHMMQNNFSDIHALHQNLRQRYADE